MPPGCLTSRAPTAKQGSTKYDTDPTAVAAIARVTAVAAQSDPIAQRKELMKQQGAQTKTGAGMAKGEAPFDLAKAQGGVRELHPKHGGKDAASLFPAELQRPAARPRPGRRSGRTMAGFKAGVRQVRRPRPRPRQSSGEGPRQLQGGVRRGIGQGLRRLPRDLPRQEELDR